MVKPAEESRSDVHFGYGGGRSWEVKLKHLNFFFDNFQASSSISDALFLSNFLFVFVVVSIFFVSFLFFFLLL